MKPSLKKEHIKTIYLVLKALQENQITNPTAEWELDFYDRPLIDNKKTGSVLEILKHILSTKDINEIDKHILIRKYGTFNNEIDENVYSNIQKALASLRRIEIEYFSVGRGSTIKRKIEVYYANRKYVIAFDHLRNDMRKFRVSRIVKAKPLTEKYSIPADFNKKEYL